MPDGRWGLENGAYLGESPVPHPLEAVTRRTAEWKGVQSGSRRPIAMTGTLSLIPIQRDGSLGGFEGTLPGVAREVLRGTAELYDAVGFEKPWICYLASAAGTVVGTCGFKSPPRSGRVELAYFTFPDFEGRGVATEMARALVTLAGEHGPSLVIAAQTLPEPAASHRILEKLGFQHVDTIDHPEDGRVWEWQLEEGR